MDRVNGVTMTFSVSTISPGVTCRVAVKGDQTFVDVDTFKIGWMRAISFTAFTFIAARLNNKSIELHSVDTP